MPNQIEPLTSKSKSILFKSERMVLTFWNCLKGTNWTISLMAISPDGERRLPPSPSRNSMALKSAPPTPTMMIDMGSLEALTIACLVSSRSVITPSVMIKSTKYCCQKGKHVLWAGEGHTVKDWPRAVSQLLHSGHCQCVSGLSTA